MKKSCKEEVNSEILDLLLRDRTTEINILWAASWAFYDITHGQRLSDNYVALDGAYFAKKSRNCCAAIKKFEEFLFETLGLKAKLFDLNIDDKNFKIMAKKACPEASCMDL